ncbi:MAG: glycosyltransferase [Candidatus Magasanikbacteria bacterium]|nr:glycosyltransferase [Candidatus Magasanikbacteria bacterium]
MKLTIIIPVYNEKNTILPLLEKVAHLDIVKEVIIVDDCSTDGTREILRSMQNENKYKILYHEKNNGKGAAIRTGLAEATGEYAVIQDADLEYDPQDLVKMFLYIREHNLEVLYGSRRLNKENKKYAGISYYLGGVFLTWVANILYGQKLTDEPTCYKMFKTDFLRSLPLACKRFEFCPEVTALSALRGIKIAEIPINYYPRTKEEGKKIGWRDALVALKVFLEYRAPRIFKFIHKHKIGIILGVAAILNLLIFKALFGFHPNNDTDSFLWLMEYFRGSFPDSVVAHPNRYLNPFYAVIGATIFRFLSVEDSLIATNIIFYFGLVFVTYDLIRRVFKSKFTGLVSALIIMTGYPMIRYSLTQVQDIGGYFWFLLTIYAGWLWWENKKIKWLLLGGVAVSFGVLTKESGCMGALFVGILFLINKDSWKNKILNFVYFSFLPFFTILINAARGKDVDYNSAQWFIENWRIFAPSNYTLFKWVGVHATTYNILWVFVLLGLFFIIKNWHNLHSNIKIYLLAVIPSSMSYYAWPLFIGRTVYISAWFFVPLAAYGIYNIYIKPGALYKFLAISAVVVCLVTPYALQSMLRYANLFRIIDVCERKPACAWNYFWHNRDNFSTTGDKNYFDYK